MEFDKDSLKPEQRKVYDQLVADLKGASNHAERQGARIAAMIPGPGDLLYAPGAMAAAEHEANADIGKMICEDLRKTMSTLSVAPKGVRLDPLKIIHGDY